MMNTAMMPTVKFSDPLLTASGEARALVPFEGLRTLWLNTGTLCNLECDGCYIESSPRNDRLTFLSRAEVASVLEDCEASGQRPAQIGLTGGEPFVNPEILAILEEILERGLPTLILSNAMRPMQRQQEALGALGARFLELLTIRVSLDHWTEGRHEALRGSGTWKSALRGLRWIYEQGIELNIAARTPWDEPELEVRTGFQALFTSLGLDLDAENPAELVLFPEMDENVEVPEISEGCWKVLDKTPSSVMCADSRMVVKRLGADRPAWLACTLIPYERDFELGNSLEEASVAVRLNHPHCARFCVLGGGSCSG